MKKSEKALEKFIEKMRQDEALQKRLNEAAEAYTGDVNNAEETVRQTIIPIAEEAGYRFSAEEYVARVKSEVQHKLANREMDEKELCTVVGGVGDVDVSGSDVNGDVTVVDQSVTVTNIYVAAFIAGDNTNWSNINIFGNIT